ncbi:hypothetical protein KGM_207553 [Danaus plexippus plexippus]|uniref:Uncharacterized protein n=1 Tax=Danaus plexippus plexippus TaxID=278856 RepID=A0A212F0I5_DANPL|nr:hypothetical protein KGM_207553 [Danaus plexippus plexippus]
MWEFINFSVFKHSRTALCISIRRYNGHRTAERVKNNSAGEPTGIRGHTGHTAPLCHMRLFTIGFDRAGPSGVRLPDRANTHSGLTARNYLFWKLTTNAPIHVLGVAAAAAAAAERRLPPSRSRPCIPIVSLYEHCPLNTRRTRYLPLIPYGIHTFIYFE